MCQFIFASFNGMPLGGNNFSKISLREILEDFFMSFSQTCQILERKKSFYSRRSTQHSAVQDGAPEIRPEAIPEIPRAGGLFLGRGQQRGVVRLWCRLVQTYFTFEQMKYSNSRGQFTHLKL